MTQITKMISDNEEDRADTMLARAMTVFDTAQEILMRAIEDMRQEETLSGTELTKGLKDLNNALFLAMSWEGKARAAARQNGGGAGAGTLDLDAARAEIGCRLDCLRAAGGGGGVSGGVE